MKIKNLKLCTVLLLNLGLTGINAQESIISAGGNGNGSGGSASYTIGQTVYQNNTAVSGTEAQGVQHPYEIFIVTTSERAMKVNLEYEVYPNPTSNNLKLKVSDFEGSNLKFRIYDINGGFIEEKKISDNETKISMDNYDPAIYFLKISENGKEVKTFKIVKNN